MSNGSECGRGGENPKNIWWNDVVKAAVSFFSLFLELVSVRGGPEGDGGMVY